MFSFRLLPIPVHSATVEDDIDETPSQPSQSLITRNLIPPYGQRAGWKPSTPDDFGTHRLVYYVSGGDEQIALKAMVVHIRNVISLSTRWILAERR
jgi:hypothetical protein